MAKLPRIFLKVFGQDGPSDDFAKFGSQVAGVPTKTKDLTLIQELAAWGTGLKNAIVAANRAPFLEDMNALFFVHSYQTAYLLQHGVAEWDINTDYHIGSIVRKAGTTDLYGSQTDDNVGNALPSGRMNNTHWKYLSLEREPAGAIKDFAGNTLPDGYLWADGSNVSRTTYADLFAAIGVIHGAGDGSTTFTLPNLDGRFVVGKSASGTFVTLGAKSGTETHSHTRTTDVGVSIPVHNHTMSHRHVMPYAANESGAHWLANTPSDWAEGSVSRTEGLFAVSGSGGGTGPVDFLKTADSDTAATGNASLTASVTQPVYAAANNLPPYIVLRKIIKF